MIKSLLTGCAFAAALAVPASAQNLSYFTEELGEVNGVSDNGRYVAVGDVEMTRAYLWDASNPDVFVDITPDPEKTINLPTGQRIVGALAYDVTDDGSLVVGSLFYADGHSVGAIYSNGEWTELALHPAAMNTNEAIAVTPDGSVIGGYQFISDETSDIAGRYYPVQWFRNEKGGYDLKAYTDITLPDHQGFYPLTQSKDGKVIAGTLFCAVQSTIPAMVIEGELKMFDELTTKSEPFTFKGRYYCGIDPETGNQIWSSDPDDPRIVMFTEHYINGFKDSDQGLVGQFANCDVDGNFYGTRTLVSDVQEDGSATLKQNAFVYNLDSDTWTYYDNMEYFTAGVGTELLFGNDKIVLVDGEKNNIAEYYNIEAPKTLTGVGKISADGKVLGGMTQEMHPGTGELMYYPFVTVTEGAFSGVCDVQAKISRASFVVSGRTVTLHNAESMNVYDLDGSLVASGRSATLEPGVYVLNAGEVCAKVAIR